MIQMEMPGFRVGARRAGPKTESHPQSSAILLRRNWDRRNREAAAIIVADPERYHPESGLSQWAFRVLGRPNVLPNLTGGPL